MRYASIDILRTLAICVMVFVHFGENLAGIGIPLAGFGAPLFAFLAGVGYRLWLQGQHRRKTPDEIIAKVSIRRGLFVFGVGLAFNILVWLPQDLFNWDVLTLIGSALILMNLMRRMSMGLWITIAGLIVFMSPFLRAMAEYDTYWVNYYYDPDMTLYDVIVGFLVVGYFPVFPWLAFSLVGYVVAEKLFVAEGAWQRTVGWGLGFVATAAVLLLLRPVLPELVVEHVVGRWSMYPPSVPYVLGTLGLAMVLLGLLHRGVDASERADAHPRLFRVFTLMSQYSFTIYLVHHVVHVWPLWIYGLATDGDPTVHWREAMPTLPAMGLAVLFLVVCYLVLVRLPANRRLGMEAWMRWLCDAERSPSA